MAGASRKTLNAGTLPALHRFLTTLSWGQLSGEVQKQSALLLLDTLGVAIAAENLQAGVIARNTAAALYAAGPGADSARLMLDGRAVSLPGFAFALASQTDNLDAHDGFNPVKGHMGVVILPTLMAYAQQGREVSGKEALTTLVAGYEIASRAGLALHATVPDYHTSGAWNALGVAAMGARLQGLDLAQLRNALGIAEFHGPRSQMMREVDDPSMLHDGGGTGALAGLSAVFMAEQGFTGGHAITVESEEVTAFWADLGQTWLTLEQYIKPYPVCRWAHAPIDAALGLKRQHGFTADQVDKVEIITFHEATRLLSGMPDSSPAAQYSLPFSVANALLFDRVGVAEITGDNLSNPEVARLVARTRFSEDPRHNELFPAKRFARVSLTLTDGRVLTSEDREPLGSPDIPLSDAQMLAKFQDLVGPVLGDRRAAALAQAVLSLGQEGASFTQLVEELLDPLPDMAAVAE
ncbi:MmgE/PrpD family protein [Rhodovibrionaceae bacterium A322]